MTLEQELEQVIDRAFSKAGSVDFSDEARAVLAFLRDYFKRPDVIGRALNAARLDTPEDSAAAALAAALKEPIDGEAN